MDQLRVGRGGGATLIEAELRITLTDRGCPAHLFSLSNFSVRMSRTQAAVGWQALWESGTLRGSSVLGEEQDRQWACSWRAGCFQRSIVGEYLIMAMKAPQTEDWPAGYPQQPLMLQYSTPQKQGA